MSWLVDWLIRVCIYKRLLIIVNFVLYGLLVTVYLLFYIKYAFME